MHPGSIPGEASISVSSTTPIARRGSRMTSFALQRRVMVENQIRPFDVTDLAVLAAFEEVPRERFVPPQGRDLAYSDREAPLSAPGRYLLAPMVLARMIQGAGVAPDAHVLDVAGGTGYSAAVLARLARSVAALEPDPGLAALAREALAGTGVTPVEGPIEDGVPTGAPYDVILVNGAVEVEPRSLFEQLAQDGRLVCVLGAGRAAKVMLYRRTGDDIGGWPLFDAAAPLLPAFRHAPAFVF